MDKQDKTAEAILDIHGDGIYRWGDYDTPQEAYVFKEGSLTREAALKAMESYAQHRTAELEAKIKALEERLEAADEVINLIQIPVPPPNNLLDALQKYLYLKK